MRRTGVALLCLPVLLASCGTEVADGAAPSTPRPLVTTPSYLGPRSSEIPRRPAPPAAAFNQVKVVRLSSPYPGHPRPTPSNAQVVMSCAYENWSPQDTDARLGYNPPGRHVRGDRQGDSLSARTGVRAGLALGDPKADVVTGPRVAVHYTEDSWPVRKVVTTFDVPRVALTKKNLADARNYYADGCTTQYAEPVLSAVYVGVYAPWSWQL